MLKLAELVTDELNRWHNPICVETIFRTADPQAIARHMNTFCENRSGWRMLLAVSIACLPTNIPTRPGAPGLCLRSMAMHF